MTDKKLLNRKKYDALITLMVLGTVAMWVLVFHIEEWWWGTIAGGVSGVVTALLFRTIRLWLTLREDVSE